MQQRVTWQEALHALLNGKTVKHVWDNLQQAKGYSCRSEEEIFAPDRNHHITLAHLRLGKWYILNDGEDR